MGILDAQTILLVLSLLLPLTVFFAAVLLSLSIFAKSYKEAQSLISPLTIVIILPVMVGIMPGIELDPVTAVIPVLNVSLATKEIIAGTIKPLLLAEVYVTLIALASLSLWGCAKWFEREETIFRGRRQEAWICERTRPGEPPGLAATRSTNVRSLPVRPDEREPTLILRSLQTFSGTRET